MSMSTPDLVKNIMRGVYRILPHIVGSEMGFKEVRQISIKGYNTPAFPIYNFISEEEKKVYLKMEKKSKKK